MTTLTTERPSPATAATIPSPTEALSLYRLSVDQYHQMIDAGVFAEDERCELIDGILVRKMGKHPPHRIALMHLRDLLIKSLPAGWHVMCQDPITTSDGEPEPDVCVVRGITDNYHDCHPGSTDLPVVAEISDSSLALDRGMKLTAYARARIVEYWIVNLSDRRLERYTQPTGEGFEATYETCDLFGPEDAVPLRIEGREVGTIAVKDILP